MNNSKKLDIREISDNLYCKDGIWFSNIKSKISYPDNENSECFKYEDESFWFLYRNEILRQIIKNFSSDINFFDIGGGNGFVSSELMKIGFNVFLVEPGIDGIINAGSRGIVNLINASCEDVGFKSESLPNVGMFDVIEHIEDDKEFIGIINKLIIQGGLVYITVPAFNFLWSVNDVYAGHYRRYNKTTLTKLMIDAGFEIRYFTYFFSYLVLPLYIIRTLISKVKRNEIYNKEKTECEHKINSKVFSLLFKYLHKLEMLFLKKQKKIPFGTSCLVVAQKIN